MTMCTAQVLSVVGEHTLYNVSSEAPGGLIFKGGCIMQKY